MNPRFDDTNAVMKLCQGESDRVTISGYHDVPANNEQSLLKALANQPLSVAIEASGRDFQFYSGVRTYKTSSYKFYSTHVTYV